MFSTTLNYNVEKKMKQCSNCSNFNVISIFNVKNIKKNNCITLILMFYQNLNIARCTGKVTTSYISLADLLRLCSCLLLS